MFNSADHRRNRAGVTKTIPAFNARGYANEYNTRIGEAKSRVQRLANTTKRTDDGAKQDYD